MSDKHTSKRSLRRFKIVADPNALIEVQIVDREGLALSSDLLHRGLHFAVPGRDRTAVAYGLQEGELLIVDLDDESAKVGTADDDGYPFLTVLCLVPVRAIVARGVTL